MLESLYKSPNDKSNYYTFQLENGLRVFLIEDSEISECAVSMRVNIGSYQDKYYKIDGLAHLLEHMLFNGTKKYPKENEFSDFVSKNNGHTNAYTSGTHTCYHYVISPNKILESLEMFADFFVNPTLDENSVDREKEAVNSEHEKNMSDDGWIESYVFRLACDVDNPYNRFSTGNKNTLNIPDIGKKVKELYDTFYSAHMMTLSIAFKENLNSIKDFVEKFYGEIKSHKTPKKIIDIPFFTKSKLVKYVPIKDIKKISYSWNIPSFRYDIKNDPNDFLSHIFGNEEENTIHHILYDKGYIKNLTSSCGYDYSYSTFTINISLTDMGFENISDVTNVIYCYVEMVKNNINMEIMKKLYEEDRELKKYRQLFFKKSNPLRRVTFLCDKYNDLFKDIKNPINIDIKELLILGGLKNDYSMIKNNIISSLENFIPDKCIVVIASKFYLNNDNIKMQFYNSEYSITNDNLNYENKYCNMIMPKINQFLPLGTEILNLPKYESPELLSNNKIKGYWFPDTTFETPDVYISSSISFPNITRDIRNVISAYLYFVTILQYNNNILYQMDSADYNINIIPENILVDNKIAISVFGNYKKIKNIFQKVIEIVKFENCENCEKILNIFKVKKESLILNMQNSIFESPYKRIPSLFVESLSNSFIKRNEILTYAKEIELEDIMNIKNNIFNSGEAVMLISGNIKKECAIEIINVTSNLFLKHDDTYILDYNIPDNKDKIIIREIEDENNNEINNALGNYLYIDKFDDKRNNEKYLNYSKNSIILKVIDAFISSDFFDILRTKECYGYIVGSGASFNISENKNYAFYKFIVQSSEKDCENITNRIDNYIVEFYEKIKIISQEDIDNVCQSCINNIQASFSSLVTKMNYIFGCIYKDQFLDGKKIAVEILKNIKKKDVTDFYFDKFINRKSLIIGYKPNKK
jgi:insulysin